ncbi:putative tumor necrosis factor receptor superfamily member [Sesbania bispinosa]|nr:putative tumor necrosis factor receptor superfamily member [Sesbania bispinosa]
MSPIHTNNRRIAFTVFKWPIVKEFLWTEGGFKARGQKKIEGEAMPKVEAHV